MWCTNEPEFRSNFTKHRAHYIGLNLKYSRKGKKKNAGDPIFLKSKSQVVEFRFHRASNFQKITNILQNNTMTLWRSHMHCKRKHSYIRIDIIFQFQNRLLHIHSRLACFFCTFRNQQNCRAREREKNLQDFYYFSSYISLTSYFV